MAQVTNDLERMTLRAGRAEGQLAMLVRAVMHMRDELDAGVADAELAQHAVVAIAERLVVDGALDGERDDEIARLVALAGGNDE